jgi:hypothetical protein
MPDDVEVIFLPQGRHSDLEVAERLRDLGWPVPYVYDHLSEPYTQTLIPSTQTLPAVRLHASEGCPLFESGWDTRTVAGLERALAPRSTAAVPARP